MIKEYFKKHIVSAFVSTIGFLAAITTIFVDLESTLNIKWFIFIIWIALMLVILLGSFIYDYIIVNYKETYIMHAQLKLKDLNEKTNSGEVFLNQSNIDLIPGDVIKIYSLDKKIENFIGIGIVNYKQEKYKNIYFSLKINQEELKILFREQGGIEDGS